MLLIPGRPVRSLGTLSAPIRATTKGDGEWVYDAAIHRYRDPFTGRFLSEARVLALREDWGSVIREDVAGLVADLADSVITLPEFERRFQRKIKTLHAAAFMLGKGGRNNMGVDDWEQVGAVCLEQFGYLRGFVEDIAAGLVSPEQMGYRAGLYVGASVQSLERGKASTYDGLRLPRYPGDGRTACLTNCRCSLRIVEMLDRWHVYWQTRADGNVCADCPSLGRDWAPLVVMKVVAE